MVTRPQVGREGAPSVSAGLERDLFEEQETARSCDLKHYILIKARPSSLSPR